MSTKAERAAESVLWDGYLATMTRCVAELLHGYRTLLTMVSPEVGESAPGGSSVEPRVPVNLDAIDQSREVDRAIDALVPLARGALRLGLWRDRHPNRAARTVGAIEWLGAELRHVYEADPTTGEQITDVLWEQRALVARITRDGGRSYRSGRRCAACGSAAVVVDAARQRARCVECGETSRAVITGTSQTSQRVEVDPSGSSSGG